MILTGPSDMLAAWAGEKMGGKFSPPYTTLGSIDRDGQLLAVFVFNNFTGNDIEVSVAANRIPLELVRAAYHYVVHQLGCQRASYRTRADNIQAQKCLERLGAQKEGVQRRYFGDCDSFIYGILREDFPYAYAIGTDASRSRRAGCGADGNQPRDRAGQRHDEQHQSGDALWQPDL